MITIIIIAVDEEVNDRILEIMVDKEQDVKDYLTVGHLEQRIDVVNNLIEEIIERHKQETANSARENIDIQSWFSSFLSNKFKILYINFIFDNIL